jgi:large subunit ribosomal protein L2
MGIKTYKPYTPSRRTLTTSSFEEITKSKPERSLTKAKKRKAGRDSAGRIAIRHRGGGHKRRLRIIDFRRANPAPALVLAIEYDPNRTARIALIQYEDAAKTKAYILAPEGLKVGTTIHSTPDAEPKVGNALPLEKIPLGVVVHNLELVPGRGAKVVRSAGNGAQVMAKGGGYVTMRLPSGEERKFLGACKAVIGAVGNADNENIILGKAGRKRWLGVRPTVRGVAMNPVDHPMGGGEGRTSGGGPSVSPWGKLAKGGKTRKPRKASNKVILKRRSK